MRMRLTGIAAAAAALALAGCGASNDIRYISDQLSGKKKNENVVLGGGAPLTVPPSYGLRPPATRGRGQARGTARLTRTVLKVGPGAAPAAKPGAPVKPGQRTAGEAEILRKAGVQGGVTTGVVRKTIDIETKREKDARRKFVDRVLKYDPKARSDDGTGKAAGGRPATTTRPAID